MNLDTSKIMGAFNDIGVRMTLSIAGTVAAGAAIVVPNGKQVEATSLEMYGKDPSQLLPNERGAAEFCAGYRRWKGFMNNNVYSWTRKLPGHNNPIVNPFGGQRMPRSQLKVEEEAAEAAADAIE